MKLKKIFLLFLFSLFVFSANAQYFIDFDNYISASDNDVTTKFLLNTTGLKQSPINGVTGGCLVPDGSQFFTYLEIDSIIDYTQFEKLRVSLYFQIDQNALQQNPGADMAIRFGGSDPISSSFDIRNSVGFQMKYNQGTVEISSVQGQAVAITQTLLVTDFKANTWYNLDFEIDQSPIDNSVLTSYTINDVGMDGNQNPQLLIQALNDTLIDCEKFKASAHRFAFDGYFRSILERIDNLNIMLAWPTIIAEVDNTFSKIKIYPTIAQSNLKIEITEDLISQEVLAIVTNYSGVVLQQSELLDRLNSLDITSFANGLYFISFYSKGKLLDTKKFIKQ